MSVSSATVRLSEVSSGRHERLDAGYFIVNHALNQLAAKSSFGVKSLRELNARISSGSYIEDYVPGKEGIKYLRVSDIKPYNVDEGEQGIVHVSAEVPERYRVSEDDIIVGRTQASVEKLGIASLVDTFLSGSAISQHVSRITVDPSVISPYYLVAYLNSNFFRAQTSLATHGDTRVEFTHSQLEQVRVFLPPRDVMERIAGKARRVMLLNRESMGLVKEAGNLLREELKITPSRWTVKNYFTASRKELQEFGQWNPKSFLPEYYSTERLIGRRFTCVKLGEIAGIRKGMEAGSENYRAYLFSDQTDYAFIRTSDIVNNEIDLYPDYFVPESVAMRSRSQLVAGDVIFSKDGRIGEVAISSGLDRAMIASGFERIRVKSNDLGITGEYLFTVLSLRETGLYPSLRRTVIASTIPHLREERLREIQIPLIERSRMDEITAIVRRSFGLRKDRKRLVIEIRDELDSYFDGSSP